MKNDTGNHAANNRTNRTGNNGNEPSIASLLQSIEFGLRLILAVLSFLAVTVLLQPILQLL